MEAGKASKKSPLQLEMLEQYYAEERCPKQVEMEEYAARLRLTYKQVRGWFVERRRKEKRVNGGRELKFNIIAREEREWCCLRSNSAVTAVEKRLRVQETLWSRDYIIRNILRKDGPPLGAEFDGIPDKSSSRSPASYFAGQEAQGAPKRRKVLKHPNCSIRDIMPKKHGVGKGMMTLWRLTNSNAGVNPTAKCLDKTLSAHTSSLKQVNRKKTLQRSRLSRKDNKKHGKNSKVPIRRKKEMAPKLLGRTDCGLTCQEASSPEEHNSFGEFIDDEELELRELQSGPKSVTCSAHFTTRGLHRCSFCKDLLSKFPPLTLKMKQPFGVQPWQSSLEMVKQFFKAVHFLYTYTAFIGIPPFTIDDFAQAFHDKDSSLLGEVHISLLKFLLSNIQRELSNGFPLQYTSCKFLGLLQSVRLQESVVGDWGRALNPLTWIEILRQIFVAAGYGSNHDITSKELQSKMEVTTMVKYGLSPGTLKGELFRILAQQGNNGMKVSELARSIQFEAPDIEMDELELLISTALSSDVTLFEKISSSAYRIRSSYMEEKDELAVRNSGSLDDCSKDTMTDSSSDSECDSGNSSSTHLHPMNSRRKQKASKLAADYEIDESHPGEIWLLGLADGEYSNLRIEEKLNVLVALVDILCGMSCFRSKDTVKGCGGGIASKTLNYGSGAKIKRPTLSQSASTLPWASVDQTQTMDDHPVDSSTLASKFIFSEGSSCKQKFPPEAGSGLKSHSMQSVFLGSDRRYNRYWLFLGPCNCSDPGHRRIYFESSEDGHWEVIDKEEAFCFLMSVLDNRGRREAFLSASLQKRHQYLLQGMSCRNEMNSECGDGDTCDQNIIAQDSSSPVSDIDNILSQCDLTQNSISSGAINFHLGKDHNLIDKWSRLQSFDRWTWNSFYATLNAVKYSRRSYLNSLARCEACHDLYWRDEKHCKLCHATFELDFDLEEKYAIHVATCKELGENSSPSAHTVLSSQLQSLKAAVYAVESAMPEDSLIGTWRKSAHKLWIKRLRRTLSLAELLQVLADFVGAINDEWVSACAALDSDSKSDEIKTSFPPSPRTSSAVALWVVKLDALIAPFLECPVVNKPKRNSRSKALTGNSCS